jgi:hypothetical protein
MSWEPISPELALVDPELRARAPTTHELPVATPPPARPTRPSEAPAAPPLSDRRYPFWARVTAALWLLVLGILIGGAAIPHAQDTPRVLPPSEAATICKPAPKPTGPVIPGLGSPLRPGS